MRAVAEAIDAGLEQTLWRALPPAVATELGALTVILLGLQSGLLTAIASLAALMVAVRVVRPRAPLLRPLVLIAGPPLRYAALLAAAVVVWLPQGGGPLPALGCLVLLGFVPPALAAAFDALLRVRPAS